MFLQLLVNLSNKLGAYGYLFIRRFQKVGLNVSSEGIRLFVLSSNFAYINCTIKIYLHCVIIVQNILNFE